MFNFQNGKYNQLYDHSIDQQNFETIKKLLLDSFTRLNDSEKPKKVYSGQIENRVGQITLSALGQQAPRNEKVAWDPTRDKRQKMALWLRPQLPKFDVKVGGSTSIDITKKGINKEFGVRNVLEYLKKDSDNAVYFGDSLEPGGNDEVVKNIAGLDTVAVRSHHETEKILREHLN
jgi:hydroxymethylpyrimidine pyrophosphatase-like HAD family hydrolase